MRKKYYWGNYILILAGIIALAWAVGTIIVSVNG